MEFITRHVRFFRTCPTAGSASGLPPPGHCFVVGARHQLRASMSAGWRGSAGQVRRNFRQSSPHRTTGFFFTVVGLDDNLDIFFSWEEPRPWRGLGRRLLCRAGAAGRLCQAGMWRARRWASPYSLGEPSNEVGRASTHWASRLARCLERLLGTSSACSARLAPARHRLVPARHV